MDEKKLENQRILRVLEKTDLESPLPVKEPKLIHANHTNPLLKPLLRNLAKFHNSKIGEGFSIRDLLR